MNEKEKFDYFRPNVEGLGEWLKHYGYSYVSDFYEETELVGSSLVYKFRLTGENRSIEISFTPAAIDNENFGFITIILYSEFGHLSLDQYLYRYHPDLRDAFGIIQKEESIQKTFSSIKNLLITDLADVITAKSWIDVPFERDAY